MARILMEDFPTVPEKLQAAGFSTSAIVASFPLAARFGFNRGFEYFDDSFNEGIVRGEWLRASPDLSETNPPPFYSLSESIEHRALERLRNPAEGNQFFWFHFFDPHSPYGDSVGEEDTSSPSTVLQIAHLGEDPTAELFRARSLYDADTRAMDDSLSALLSLLEEDPETHIIIVSDHGESFGEYGSMAHGRRLIDSQIRVPCVIRSPRLAPGRREDLAGSVDIAATILGFAGLENLSELTSGRDLSNQGTRQNKVFGMRRTYASVFADRRLDGSTVDVFGLQFYAVDQRGIIRRGNAQGLVTLGDEPSPNNAEASSLKVLFSSFEKQLLQSPSTSSLNEEEEKTLRSLGYVPLTILTIEIREFSYFERSQTGGPERNFCPTGVPLLRKKRRIRNDWIRVWRYGFKSGKVEHLLTFNPQFEPPRRLKVRYSRDES